MKVFRTAFPVAAGLLLAAVTPAAHADTTAIGFTSGAVGIPDSASDEGVASYDLGYSFTVNDPLVVTQLGWYYDPAFVNANGDSAPDGAHPVGLFNSLGVLLTSATVSYDNSGTYGYSYAAAAPTTLLAGQTYTIAGVSGAEDPFLLDIEDTSQPSNIGLIVDPALTYDQDQIDAGTTLADPTDTDSANLVDPAFFGPDFQFVAPQNTSVPEASPCALLGLGLVPLGGLLARRKRRA